MNRLLLRGCQTLPLLSYLKALGILRMVTEQIDPEATGHWTGTGFVLITELDDAGLRSFFLQEYSPTPIAAPWNGRSGFFQENYDRPSEQLLRRLADSDTPRLQSMRAVIAVGLQMHSIAHQRGWIVYDEKKEKWEVHDKTACVTYCRNHMPEEAVEWIDTVATLADHDPAYGLVVGGSGGNLGSLDLTNNLYQHLSTVVIEGGDDEALRLLSDSLSGSCSASATAARIAQLDPGRAGGVGRQRDDDLGKDSSWVNPWDFVLGLEGSLIFAAARARSSGRQGGGGVTAMPFTVRHVAVGAADQADDEKARGEIWLPLWRRPTGLDELRRLFGEGRAQWGGRQAANPLDFAQAAATLGADRGVDAFARVTIAQRLGQMNLAVPSDRVVVTSRPEVQLLAPVDRWLNRVRSLKEPSAAVASALRTAGEAQYRVSTDGDQLRLAAFLQAVAALEGAVSRSGEARERVPPLSGLDATAWVARIDDRTPEFAVAAGLASLRSEPALQPDGAGRVERAHTLGSCLRPITGPDSRRRWSPDTPISSGLGSRSLANVLAEILQARSRIPPSADADLESPNLLGVEPWFRYGWLVPAGIADAFAAGLLDDDLIAGHLAALVLLDWEWTDTRTVGDAGVLGRPLPPRALLAPFYAPRSVDLAAADPLSIRLRPQADWARQLAAGHVQRVLAAALHRLRVARLTSSVSSASTLAAGADGPLLAASLLLHHPSRDVRACLKSVVMPDKEPIA